MAVFRVEKTKDFTIMCNHHLRNRKLSLKAKGLLSLMLSLPEDWDYTTKGLAHICKDGIDAISTALKELEQQGYLTRECVRLPNGRLGDIEYTIHEQPATLDIPPNSPKRENPRQVNPGQAFPEQVKPEQENHAQLNTNRPKTEKENTDISSTHQSIYPKAGERKYNSETQDRMDWMDEANAYRDLIMTNIEYDILCERHGEERMDEVVELMLEAVISKRPYWESNVEMTARAFACYVKDRLPYQSDYLVGHAESCVTIAFDKSGHSEVIRAYPQGEERKAINAAFDEIVADLKLERIFTHTAEITALEASAIPLKDVAQLSLFGSDKPSVIGQLASAKAAEKAVPTPKKTHEPER